MSHGKAHPAEVARIRREADAMAQDRSDSQVQADVAARSMASQLARVRDRIQDLEKERSNLMVRFIEAADAAGWTASAAAHTVRELGGR